MTTRVALSESLRTLRDHGEREVVLVGRALPPWMKTWAEENGVAFSDDPDAPLGRAYLMRVPDESDIPELRL